jgi:Uncharacterised nucleotidyltransferase
MLKAKDVLILQGYDPNLKLTVEQETAYLKSHHDYKFVRSKDGVVVEIQWGITQWSFAFPLDFEDLWKRRQKSSLAGVEIESVSLDDLLLVLCVHGTKHHWSQLKWICDIAELAEANRKKLDWNRLIDHARDRGGERMLLLGLFLAHSLLGTGLPAEALKRIHRDPQIKLLAEQVRKRLFPETSATAKLRDETPFFYLQSRDRLQDKLALLLTSKMREKQHFSTCFRGEAKVCHLQIRKCRGSRSRSSLFDAS